MECDLRIKHSFREGNKVAEYFTNLVFDFAGNFQFNSLQEVLRQGRRLKKIDKLSIPNIRRSAK